MLSQSHQQKGKLAGSKKNGCRNLQLVLPSWSTPNELPSVEEALQWVEDNLYKIKGYGQKFLPYSPYELSDFVQEARSVALSARADLIADQAMRQRVSFEACFWTLLKIAYSSMASNPSFEDIFGNNCPEELKANPIVSVMPENYAVSPVAIEAAQEAFNDHVAVIDGYLDGFCQKKQDEIVQKAVEKIMMPRQKKVWRLLLKNNPSCPEIAKKQRCTTQNVHTIMKQGLNKVAKFCQKFGYGELCA